jgi:TPR repeat protein
VGFYLQTGVLDGISVNGKDIGRKEMFTDTSVPFFKKAYALGYSEAAYDLAFYYFKKSYGYKFYCHKPVPLNIQRRLKYWATKAMRHEHGIRRGQMCHFIGWYYYQFGNKNTAVAYWRRGARAGCIESCIELGICYGWGEGVSRNIKRSLYWFARSIILDRKVIGRVKREMRRMGIVYGDGFRRLCSAWER